MAMRKNGNISNIGKYLTGIFVIKLSENIANTKKTKWNNKLKNLLILIWYP